MADWQPIETAPKDKEDGFLSKRILLASTSGSMFIGYWCERRGGWHDTSTHAPCFSAPTHWHPLPAPPRVED